MSAKHTFEQNVITGCSGNWFAKESRWQRFKRVCNDLGYSIKVTGGTFLTHEINGSKEDFEVILDLINK